MARPDEDRVLSTITVHAVSLLRIARAHSLCHDDAQDAYQRTLEIYLERRAEVRAATAGEWLRTVCKHEAMRLRAARQRVLGDEPVAWDLQADDAAPPEERAVSLERVAQAAEALQGCKPDESTAILLKAAGASYAEIGDRTGWTYTKEKVLPAHPRRSCGERSGAGPIVGDRLEPTVTGLPCSSARTCSTAGCATSSRTWR